MGRYEELRAAHTWNVPERYNIAQDVCDKHPRDKPAMVWERFDGRRRDLVWGELQDLANQAAHVLREHGVDRGERVAVVLPPTPETAAIYFGARSARSCCPCRCSTATTGSRTASTTRAPACWSPTGPTPTA